MPRIYIILIFCFYFFSTQVAGQINGQIPNEYRHFIENDTKRENSFIERYVLVQANSIEKLKGVNIVRKLNHNFYIIRINDDIRKSELQLIPINNLWKLSSNIKNRRCRIENEITTKIRFTSGHAQDILTSIREINGKINILKSAKDFIFLKGTVEKNIINIAAIPEVTYIDIQCDPPVEERIVKGLDFSTNKINVLKSKFSNIDGTGVGVVVQENSMDFEDIDLLGKVVNQSIASSIIQTHATTMSTIIGGTGNSYFLGEGVAKGTMLMSTDFRFLVPPDISFVPDTFRTINHSYGTVIENFYGLEAKEYDRQVDENTDMIHIFSAGNKGDSSSVSGIYGGIPGYANLTGNFKQAKNIITVGAIDSFHIVEQKSSKGPAYDGRIKPDFVAYGEDGSSGAAAITSGLTAVLQNFYFDKYGIFPRFDLLKSALIASADDIDNYGPDFTSGYGSINGLDALKIFLQNQYHVGIIAKGQKWEEEIDIPYNVAELRIALSWIDPPSNENDNISLFNDLDIICQSSNGTQYQPLILSHQPDVQFLSKVAIPGRDSINNSELVIIRDVNPGKLRIEISGDKMIDNESIFSIAYHMEYIDTLEWIYPAREDILEQNSPQLLRWHSSLDEEDAMLLWKQLSDETWTESARLDTGVESIYWKTPSIFSEIQLRIKTPTHEYTSDTITISPSIKLDVVNLCGDELLLQWDRVGDEQAYQLHRLEDDLMKPFLITTENFQMVNVATEGSIYYAIQPLSDDNVSGRRSETINYEFLRPPCYVQSFSGEIVDSEMAELKLALSILENVENIQIFKIIDNVKTLLHDIKPKNLNLSFIDNNLINGFNIYLAEILLTNGQTVSSEEIILDYVPLGIYNIVQNPVLEGDDFVIIKNGEELVEMDIYNVIGNLVRSVSLRGSLVFVETSDFPSGIYPYVIHDEGNILQKGMLVII